MSGEQTGGRGRSSPAGRTGTHAQRPQTRLVPGDPRSAPKFYQVCSIITGTMLLLLVTEMIVKYALGYELFLGGSGGFLWFAPVIETAAGRESTGDGLNLSLGILVAHGWFYVVYLFSCFRIWSLMRWGFGRLLLLALGRHHPAPVVLHGGARRPRGQELPDASARPQKGTPPPSTRLSRTRSPRRTSGDTRPIRCGRRDVAAPGARRRFRRAVRTADRAARARSRRVQRDRAAHGVGRRYRGEEPGRHHPLRRSVLGVRGGRAGTRLPGSSTSAFRRSASATASRSWRRRSAARSPTPGCVSTGRRMPRSPATAACCWAVSPASRTSG